MLQVISRRASNRGIYKLAGLRAEGGGVGLHIQSGASSGGAEGKSRRHRGTRAEGVGAEGSGATIDKLAAN